MADQATQTERVFKSAWFAKAAKKAHIPNKEALYGHPASDDRSGLRPRRRSLQKAIGQEPVPVHYPRQSGRYWVYEYLLAKKDRANIEDVELADFRKLAKTYGGFTGQQVSELTQHKDWVEICN